MYRISLPCLLLIALCPAVGCARHEPAEDELRWWKGNLHTHTLWSDGEHYPEVVADWYKRQGYHFLAISDHNILSRGQKWIRISAKPGTGRDEAALNYYRRRFGDSWVQTRRLADGTTEVRLKPLREFRTLFEEPGRFLLIESEEITDRQSVHLNATNLAELINPQGGLTTEQIIERNIRAVFEQERRTGQPMFPHLNHPNFSRGVTVEEMVGIADLQFFEIYNGHRAALNYGNPPAHIPPLERMWDVILALRLGVLGLGPLYGLAVDDAHQYAHSASDTSLPGRGWIMVRSAHLTPDHIVEAIKRGDYYASTGVLLRRVDRRGGRIDIEVKRRRGVRYTIEFIGTRRGFESYGEIRLDEHGRDLRATRRYTQQIGRVLKRVEGTRASYELGPDDLYARARIISTRRKANPFQEGELEMAWVQPVFSTEIAQPRSTPPPRDVTDPFFP